MNKTKPVSSNIFDSVNTVIGLLCVKLGKLDAISIITGNIMIVLAVTTMNLSNHFISIAKFQHDQLRICLTKPIALQYVTSVDAVSSLLLY
jgi:sugar (pentulose or hexulose) kinase